MSDPHEAGYRPYARASRENRVYYWRETQNHQARQAPRTHRTTGIPERRVDLRGVRLEAVHCAYTTNSSDARYQAAYISYAKPHNSTVGKWAKSVLKDSGIDIGTFSGNSARPASTSYGAQAGLTLAENLKAGGWTNAQTFANHYHKPIEGNFGASILSHFQNSSE